MKNKLQIIAELHAKSLKVIDGPALAGFFTEAKSKMPELSHIVFKYESKQILPNNALNMLKSYLTESFANEILSQSESIPKQTGQSSKAWSIKLYDKQGKLCKYAEKRMRNNKLEWNHDVIIHAVDSHSAAVRWANIKLAENADSDYAEIMNIERGEVMRISRTDGNAKAYKLNKQPISKSSKASTQKLWMKVKNSKANFSNG